ncbi:CsbD family protein [Halomonas sp. V046]|uniref:CsbD family protein n=1 Tax=Halomonas sp. V046 TaxID=3459611 RepID=UPI004044B69E
MNSDQLKGGWKQLKGEAKLRWGKLTDDDLDVIDGEREKLVGKLQERHGLAREEAEKEVDEFHRDSPNNV